ncbi:type II toxin-antitoxin system HicA family toxin [Lysinibacillus sphaericus]|uniref:type II toxin-antitoxin system HicA family toxin n=1 Tax=Lysinibacillus sphaericus TaxID=1421 RepID=UPI003D7F2BEE
MKDISSREMIKIINKDGWYLHRIAGSHHHFKHPTKKGIVTVPHPRKDLLIKTTNSILKQAGLK